MVSLPNNCATRSPAPIRRSAKGSRGSFGRPALLAALASLGAVVIVLGGPGSAAAVVSCDRVAATNGSDGAAGTVAAPYRTPQKLVGSLAPGQTGCLRSGTYGWSGDLSIRTAAVTVASYPGEHATLAGRLRIEATADDAVVEGLTLDGRNSNAYLSPLVYADRAVLRDNEITNHHTAICVHLDAFPGSGPPRGVVIEGNRIHDCGRLPATNKDHGIYLGKARDTVIRDNWIYSNADRGIQLYPDADGSVIAGNVIDGNGQGISLGGGSGTSSDNNLIEHNVITNSTIRYNVEAYWSSPVGTGNVVRDNCSFGGAQGAAAGGVQSPAVGFVATGNVVADPQYRNRSAGDFGLARNSPCMVGGEATASGGGACDVVKRGTSAHDVLAGTRAGDELTGRGGADVLEGRGGKDCLSGGSGRDRLNARDGSRDVVRCGSGRDFARVDRRDRVSGCERLQRR